MEDGDELSHDLEVINHWAYQWKTEMKLSHDLEVINHWAYQWKMEMN